MRQELIDLLLGELEPAEAEALKARLKADGKLATELAELESLFSLMRRGDEIEAPAAAREAVLAEAARVRPPLVARLRALPGLFAYRFRTSTRFRVAAISLGVHVAVMAVLASILLRPAPRPNLETILTWDPSEVLPVRPAETFVHRLELRRVPHTARLKQFGVPGQEEAIRGGLEQLLARQESDGSFGDAAETAYATLALLAEGDCSTQPTRRGRAIRAARDHLFGRVRAGAVDGAILGALVEDYTLSYGDLDEQQRLVYAEAIRRLTLLVPDDDVSREGLMLAFLAGFPIPAGRELGDALVLDSHERSALLALEPTRLRATVALARGPSNLDSGRVRDWAAPLFEGAMAAATSGNVSAVVLLTLQAPYRL